MCISVRQPWAWAILHAGKRIENRAMPDPWRSRVGQRIYIHASKGCTREEHDDASEFIESLRLRHLVRRTMRALAGRDVATPPLVQMPRGAIVGTAYLSAVVNRDNPRDGSKVTTGDSWDALVREVTRSAWSVGPWCLVLRDVKPLSQPLPWNGALGWFPGPPDAEAALDAWAAASAPGDDL